MNRWQLAAAIASFALSACEPGEPAPEASRPGDVSEQRAAELFAKHCAICHGETGDGHGPRRGSLYRKPPDFRDPGWRAGRTVPSVAAVIRDGVPGSDMPGWRRLDDAEIAALAEFVLGLSRGRS